MFDKQWKITFLTKDETTTTKKQTNNTQQEKKGNPLLVLRSCGMRGEEGKR